MQCGRPLESLQYIVRLISSTTTSASLEVRCTVDPAVYERRIKVAGNEMESIDIERDGFHGE